MRLHRWPRLATLALAGGLSIFLGGPLDVAQASAGGPGTPSQATFDLPGGSPGNPGAGWADMPGGAAARPYVTQLTIINGDVSTPVVTGGTTADPAVTNGGVTTVVEPVNLCAPGQTPAPGVCYATPNRVALDIAYANNQTDGLDFLSPIFPVTPTINANTIIDMTVAMNTLGKSLRWTGVNGDLLFWQTTNLGQDDATVHIKFHPAIAPWVQNFPSDNRCTASPPMNCTIAAADSEVLTASIVFSLDNTLDPALTGAAFATQDAFDGFLTPTGTAQAPSLDIEVASTHTKSDGTPQLGTLEAFLPASALINLYGVLPADAATFFTTTRLGDPGTNNSPAYTPWTAATNGSDGLMVTVSGITFSVPNYRVSGRLKRLAVHATTRGAKTSITASLAGCSRSSKCLVSVYRLGRANANLFLANKTTVVANSPLNGRSLALKVQASKLRRGDRFLLVVHALRHRALVASSAGTVA